ncbi:MAG: glycosyltransferase family 2 protein [Planctomycetota bacterium]
MPETSFQPDATPVLAAPKPDTPRPDAKATTVAAIIVTWNRRKDVLRVLDRLAAQIGERQALHAIVVANGCVDGTEDAISERLAPEQVISNNASDPAVPVFETHGSRPAGTNLAGIDRLTVIRNRHNLGGCGGFNTGMRFVAQSLGRPGTETGPDFLWLLDDDIDLPKGALNHLLAAADSDPGVALVGSRTVDLRDRATTIESTIYFDADQGRMAPEPPAGHPLEASHHAWAQDRTGDRSSGTCEVDVVSACSMLVRWKAIERVGFWDDRFFIYCDDADWCLRLKRDGWRVVCAMDAVVYHTPWTHKLTPSRGYYLHRNLLWMIRKHLTGATRRRAVLRWCARLLREARSAAVNRRLTEAGLLLRSIEDAATGRGGKLENSSESCDAVQAVLEAAHAGGWIAVPLQSKDGFLAAERLRAHVTNTLIAQGRGSLQPRWRYLAEEGLTLATHGGDGPVRGEHRPELVRYRPTRVGKLAALARIAPRPPAAVVVIDGDCAFPLVLGGPTLRFETGQPEKIAREPGGLLAMVRFACRWMRTGLRAAMYAMSSRERTPAA